jgi:HEXXH motif-containing protein
MRRRLADSLRHVIRAAVPPLAIAPRAWPGFQQRLAHAPVSPLVFGAYCDLVLALDAADLTTAQSCLTEILAARNHSGGPRVVAFADPRRDPASARYLRLIDTDPTLPFTIVAPKPAVAAACRARLARALDLLQAGCPPLLRELRALVLEIVLASPPPTPGAARFDGASSFLLWGAIVLNAESHATDLEMVQALAHESGHNLLFGLCADGPLVDQDDAERYASPLRDDLRPMDGIVHATYVIARMHLALNALLRSGVLEPDARKEARDALDRHVRNFRSGLATIDRHARLTARGRNAVGAARRYMDRARLRRAA